MSNINHADTLDLRALAEIAREAALVLEDPESYDEDERETALEDLEALAGLAEDIGLSIDRTDWDTVGDELDRWGEGYECTLISENHFEDYCKELVSDIGDLPRDLPDYIKDNIDWSGVADDLNVDYNDVDLEGQTYKIRAA